MEIRPYIKYGYTQIIRYNLISGNSLINNIALSQ